MKKKRIKDYKDLNYTAVSTFCHQQWCKNLRFELGPCASNPMSLTTTPPPLSNEEKEKPTFNSCISIHYPGIVRDIPRMLETLGGIRTISSTYCEKNRRLELHWRPGDSFCKPTFASRRPIVGLLLKVKLKKKKNEQSGTIVACEPIGTVTEEYKFSNLCDFQFLATTKDKFLYDAVIPHGLDPDWLNSEASYFLPPAGFSRVDTVQNFAFSKVPSEEEKPDVIGRLKRKRYGCTKCLTFDNPEVPTLPKEVPLGGISSAKLVTSDTIELLKLLFQERPIYSRAAIRCISKLPMVQLKCILPCVAYYFVNGPWRSLWVRFGYDPRKDPESRIYQTLDYRVRSNLSKDEIKNKRPSLGSLSYKFTNPTWKSTSVISRNPMHSKEKEEPEQEEYIFKPEMIPPSRQCYYQYCDIHIPEVKAIFDVLEVDENAICHEMDGWLPSGTADTCRDIMNKYVSEEVKRKNKLSHQSLIVSMQNAPSSGSESNSSDSEL